MKKIMILLVLTVPLFAQVELSTETERIRITVTDTNDVPLLWKLHFRAGGAMQTEWQDQKVFVIDRSVYMPNDGQIWAQNCKVSGVFGPYSDTVSVSFVDHPSDPIEEPVDTTYSDPVHDTAQEIATQMADRQYDYKNWHGGGNWQERDDRIYMYYNPSNPPELINKFYVTAGKYLFFFKNLQGNLHANINGNDYTTDTGMIRIDLPGGKNWIEIISPISTYSFTDFYFEQDDLAKPSIYKIEAVENN